MSDNHSTVNCEQVGLIPHVHPLPLTATAITRTDHAAYELAYRKQRPQQNTSFQEAPFIS